MGYMYSRRLNESSKNKIDLNTATTEEMEEFLADHDKDIEIVEVFSDKFDRLLIKQSRKDKTCIVSTLFDIPGYIPAEMVGGDLAVFEDGKPILIAMEYTIKSEYKHEWYDDDSFNNRKHILLKLLIKYYYKLV